MAVELLAYTTAGVNLAKNFRKIQGPMITAYKKATPEWDWYDDIPEEDITISAREMTVPVDIQRQGGTAVIPEAGYEAQTFTAPLQEITLSWANLNQRWFTSFTSKYLAQRNAGGMVTGAAQLKYQAAKAMQAISIRTQQMFYGETTGVVCQTSTIATQASGTYALTAGYGQAGITDTTFCASFFALNDWVALVRAGALVTNAIGEITAIDNVNGITVTWIGSVTSAANDNIVFANNSINATAATLATGTDYNGWPVGLLSANNDTTVHGLSGGTYPDWNPAYTSATAGRFSAVKMRRAIQEIQNKYAASGGFDVLLAQGVDRDLFSAERGAVRYADPENMQLDGSYKYKGVRFLTSPAIPNGYVFVKAKGAIGKFSLLPKPDESTGAVWDDGWKAEDRNGLKFSVDWPFAFVVKARRGLAQFSNQTES
jgi:hypothetical protein